VVSDEGNQGSGTTKPWLGTDGHPNVIGHLAC
jgi:hypothetical protein